MRILHLTGYNAGDGVSIAVQRLHRGLLGLGHESMVLVGAARTPERSPGMTVFAPPMDLRSRVRRKIRTLHIARALHRHRRPPGYELFSDDRSPYGADILGQLPACDIIDVHAMLHFVDFRDFFTTIPRRIPVVRTLHDMTFFTGGCHYDFNCGKYTASCGACPQLGSRDQDDLSRQIWRRKHSALRVVPPGRLHLVAMSRWLAEQAQRSSLLRGFPVTVIPPGVDTEIFCPRDKGKARETLGIPQDAGVVLFVAEPLTRRIKGFALLAEALRECDPAGRLVLVSAGSGAPPAEVAIPHMRLGHIGNPRLLSLVYSAADVFVMPSLQEAFGKTAIEAMACGTPVVAFGVGGLLDIVRPGVSGLLVPPHDVAALGVAIRDLLHDRARRADMGASARRLVVAEYSVALQLQRHVALYERVLAEQRPVGVSRAGADGERSAVGRAAVAPGGP